jgi:purine-binding chemotaxis protein CheW
MTDLQPLNETVKAIDQQSVMTFMLDDQRYALPIEPIVQIIPMVTLTPLPQITKVVEGIINVRGMVVPIVNMRRHLGLPEIPLELHTPILLVKVNERAIGLIVDEVLDVINLSSDHIARPSEVLPAGFGDVPILRGLGYVQGAQGMVMLLEIENLFHPEQVEALAQAMQALPEAAAAWRPAEAAAVAEPEPIKESKPARKKRVKKKDKPAEESKPARKKSSKKKEEPTEEDKPARKKSGKKPRSKKTSKEKSE